MRHDACRTPSASSPDSADGHNIKVWVTGRLLLELLQSTIAVSIRDAKSV
jgi:hypothetical protein